MDGSVGHRPKSIVLVFLIEYYPAALEHDWQTRFGRSITDLRAIGWQRAWWWTSEILRDPYSHSNSALRGDKRVPHPAEEAALNHLEGWINAQRGRGKIAQRLDRPWAGTPPKYDEGPKAPDPGRSERRRQLEAFNERRQALLDQS